MSVASTSQGQLGWHWTIPEAKQGAARLPLSLWEGRDRQPRPVPAEHPLEMLPPRAVPPSRRGEGLAAGPGEASKETCRSPTPYPIPGCTDSEQRGA